MSPLRRNFSAGPGAERDVIYLFESRLNLITYSRR